MFLRRLLLDLCPSASSLSRHAECSSGLISDSGAAPPTAPPLASHRDDVQVSVGVYSGPDLPDPDDRRIAGAKVKTLSAVVINAEPLTCHVSMLARQLTEIAEGGTVQLESTKIQ